MAKKPPTHAQVKERIALAKKEQQAAERQEVIEFLQDKSLKMIFHLALGLESLDYLRPTNNYSKELKLHGNRFLAALEKHIAPKIDALYADSPEFSTNMIQQLEEVGNKWSQILFSDYPVINRMADEYKKDPEHWRKNVTMQFNRLDADKVESNE